MRNYLLLVMAASAFIFTSCNNDDDPPTPSKTELISNKNWKLTSQTESENGAAAVNTYAAIAACSQDDIFIFSPDGKFTWDEGATKCNPNDNQTVATGTWTFTNEEAKISITTPGSTSEFELQELTTTQLVIKETETTQAGTTVTTSTYTRQ